MGLPEIYEKLFGKEATDEVAEVKAEAGSEAAAATEEKTELTEEQIDAALNEMSEDELSELAKEVAADTKESAKNDEAAHQKEAEELYAAGRIFGQGFIAETGAKTEKTATGPSKAMAKFATLLEKELGKK